MKYLKNFFAALLAGIMLLMLFTGCSSQQPVNPEQIEQTVLDAVNEVYGTDLLVDDSMSELARGMFSCVVDGYIDYQKASEYYRLHPVPDSCIQDSFFYQSNRQILPVTSDNLAEYKAYVIENITELSAKRLEYNLSKIGIASEENADGSFHVIFLLHFTKKQS